MDRKLKRQILFKPGQSVSTEPSEKKAIKPKEQKDEKKETKPHNRSAIVYKWIQDHPLINLNGVCKEAGIDRANFVKGMVKGKPIKDDTLTKIIDELKKYGYAE